MADVALELRHLHKSFGNLKVTQDVSLQLHRGELHALIGPNGAGKTTLVAQIAGQLQPDSGSISLQGTDITGWPSDRRARHGLGRSFQISRVFRSMPAGHNVGLALNAHQGRRSFFARFSTAALHDQATQHLSHLGFEDDGRQAGSLAYGSVRQLELAMSMAAAPAVLLLDEPLAGLSPAESQTAIQRLAELKGKTSILLIEHDIDAVFRLADRLTVLVAGAVIATGTPDQIRESAEVRAAYLGDE